MRSCVRSRGTIIGTFDPELDHYRHRSVMSGKLSPALKALLGARHAKGSAIAAPAKLDTLFDSVYHSAKAVGLGHDTVLTLSVESSVLIRANLRGLANVLALRWGKGRRLL